MRKVTVITSFDQSYYDKVGKHCLETMLQYWDPNIHIVLYVEDFELFNNSRFVKVPFEDLDPDYFVFQKEKRKASEKTFAKKAYSIIHAMENIETDILVWLDADVVTKKHITKEFIESLIPEDKLSTHLGVWHHAIKHDETSPLMFSCETGFFALNKNHKHYDKFVKRYKERYVNREKEDLRRFYDGDVYGAVVKEFKEKEMNDINPGMHKTPMSRSILKSYLVHFKHGLKRRDDFEKLVEKVKS
jgi:hypothetical protein